MSNIVILHPGCSCTNLTIFPRYCTVLCHWWGVLNCSDRDKLVVFCVKLHVLSQTYSQKLPVSKSLSSMLFCNQWYCCSTVAPDLHHHLICLCMGWLAMTCFWSFTPLLSDRSTGVNAILVGVGVSGFWRCLRSLFSDI